MQKNTILNVDTDAGKTMITAMIIREIARSLRKQPSEKKLIIFLAPSCDLVQQVHFFITIVC